MVNSAVKTSGHDPRRGVLDASPHLKGKGHTVRNPIDPGALGTAGSHALAADSAKENTSSTWLVSLLPDTTQALGAGTFSAGLVVAGLWRGRPPQSDRPGQEGTGWTRRSHRRPQ